MLYELELRRHRNTHRLLSAASSQLHSWRAERERRTVSPFHFSPVPASSPEVTSMPVMYIHDCLGCAVLLCLVCLFDLACFFLSSFSSLINKMCKDIEKCMG